MELMEFKKGMEVRYIGPRTELLGSVGKVKQVVKSRKVVTVDFDHLPGWYDAQPSSLEAA